MYNVRPPPPGRETITIGDRRRIQVEYIGNMDVIFHGKNDQRIILSDVAYVSGLGFNLYSLHAVQRTHLIVSDASGTHTIGANLTFHRSSSGSYLHATRLPAVTVGARRRQREMPTTNLLRQLRHPVPPPPSRDVTWHYSKAPWSTPVRTARIKPPRDTYVPMPKSVPVAALSPAPAAAPLAPAPASTTPLASVLKLPAPIPPRVGRDIKKRGKRGDAGEDAWRDPCNARCIAGIRSSPWRTVDDGTCGSGVNAGDSRINQQDRPSAQRPERLAGPADRAYTGYLQTK